MNQERKPHAPAVGPNYADRYALISLETKQAAGRVVQAVRPIGRLTDTCVGSPAVQAAKAAIATARRELDALESLLP